MADNRTKPKPRPVAPAADAQQQTVIRPARPEAESIAALIAEAERIMGVEPARTSRPLPGY